MMHFLRSFTIAAALVAAGAASSQEADSVDNFGLTFDPAPVDVCMEDWLAGRGRDNDWRDGGAQACIGLAAQACLEGESGNTTVGMSYCVGQEFDLWDKRLNSAYEAVMADAKKVDKEMADLGSAAPETAGPLRQMQRDWIAFRDSACEYEVSRWGGGTGGGPAGYSCLMTLTAQQYFWLLAYVPDPH
ncbi:MAG: lysozyme inhibitor LprI family protein [Paracoccus sp. (in: a-proteobacteria)]|nr:lysozyme inhibitor LprI family protein [Paracoccus sp. (in: a-proteobacteria)]